MRSCSSSRATCSCSRRARTRSRPRTRRASPQAHRRGRERADVGRGRRDPRRARHPRAAGRPHERRRRDRLVLRVGAGPRPPVLDRDEIRARLADKLGDAFDRVWELSEERGISLRRRGARRRRSARSRARSRRAGSIREPARPRRDGARAADARRVGVGAQEAGELLARPEVRAVLVCDDGGGSSAW